MDVCRGRMRASAAGPGHDPKEQEQGGGSLGIDRWRSVKDMADAALPEVPGACLSMRRNGGSEIVERRWIDR